MADNKKSFVLYADQKGLFEKLSNEQAGKLIKHIYRYVNDENPELPEQDFVIEIAFEPIKLQLKRDLKKWESYLKKQRENGAKGGRPSQPKETQKTQPFSEDPKKPDNVNDNVTVNDIKEGKSKTFPAFINELYNEIIQYFPNELLPETDKQVENWKDTLDKLHRIDNYTPEQIEYLIKWARHDDFWHSNFLSILKLRKKNKEGIKYAKVLEHQLKKQNKNYNGTLQQFVHGK